VKMNLLLMTVLFAPATFAAPGPSSLDKFLASAWGDHKVTLQQKNVAEFGKSSGFKPLEGAQLILSQNEVVEDQKIALRFLPRGWTQDRLIRTLSAGQNRIEALNSQKAVTQSLLERYMAAAEYMSAFEVHRLWASIETLRSKRLSMLQVAARSSQSRAVDLVKQREETEQSDVKAVMADSELRMALVKMKALDPSFSPSTVLSSDLPTPADMLKVVVTSKPETAFAPQLARENAARAHDTFDFYSS
jgi:hypothetical protein